MPGEGNGRSREIPSLRESDLQEDPRQDDVDVDVVFVGAELDCGDGEEGARRRGEEEVAEVAWPPPEGSLRRDDVRPGEEARGGQGRQGPQGRRRGGRVPGQDSGLDEVLVASVTSQDVLSPFTKTFFPPDLAGLTSIGESSSSSARTTWPGPSRCWTWR